MDHRALLRETVAEFFQTDAAEIDRDFRLTGQRLQGSIARVQLDAAVRRRLGIKCEAVYSAATYGELELAVLGTQAPAEQTVPQRATELPITGHNVTGTKGTRVDSNCACGVDIELVENLPHAENPWEDPFYKLAFSHREIAYCLAQDNPPEHFAARWAAKEALKKCLTKFLGDELSRIELCIHEDGTISLKHRANGTATPLPVAVSVSHTATMAAAIVVHVGEPAGGFSETSTPKDSDTSNNTNLAIWTLGAASVALAVAIWALLRTV